MSTLTLPLSKRPYSPPFSRAETAFLLELVQKHGKMLEGKETDANSMRDRNACWETLCEEFNSKGLVSFRNAASLRNKWKLMKKEARKEYADHKRYSNGTGGGPPPKDLSDLYYSIIGITGDVSIEGGKGSPDCDYTLINQTTAKPTINGFPLTNQVGVKAQISPGPSQSKVLGGFPRTNQVAKPQISPGPSQSKVLGDSLNDSELENLLEEVHDDVDNTVSAADVTVWNGSGYTTTMLKKQKSKPLRDASNRGNKGNAYSETIEKKKEVLKLQEGHFLTLQQTQVAEKKLLEQRIAQEKELHELRMENERIRKENEKQTYLRETEDFKKRMTRDDALFTAQVVERTIKKKRETRLFELEEKKLLLEIERLEKKPINNNDE